MLKFRFDVYAWIPQPEVPNPISSLPGGIARWGPGACGPYFGGDNFILPPATHVGWPPRTYRARQAFEFQDFSFGYRPVVTINTGVTPGTTTVLTATRTAGGTVCSSLTATVKTSSASMVWSAADGWYEVKMHGAAQDPVPAAVGGRVAGGVGSTTASALTPNLEWELKLRIQSGLTIPTTTKMRYGISSGLNLDAGASTFPGVTTFGGTANLMHGLITVRRFPSYIVYGTVDIGKGGPRTVPIYFADASKRGLLEIAIGQTDTLRHFTW
jgi:hypothetical protein